MKVQRMISKGLKIALHRRRLHNTRLLHKQARLASWETRARLALNKLIFKYKFVEEMLDNGSGTTRLQGGTVFKLEKPNSGHFINSVAYQCRKLWNDLPSHLRSIVNRETFNVLVKGYHRDMYFENNTNGIDW